MAKNRTIILGANISADGDAKAWPGGRGLFSCEATWGGGTVKLQFKSVNGTWIDVGTASTLTANGIVGFELPSCEIRVDVTTATAVYAYAHTTETC